MKYLKGFGLFWYDFLVGDSIFLAIGGVLILAMGFALVELHAQTLAEIVLPAAVVATIFMSLPELRRN